jgi:hypothetical protein
MPKQRAAKPLRLGLAWFDREQWQRLTEVVPDRSELDETFEQWERNARKAMKELERRGQLVEKVLINVDELLAWCTLTGLAPNGKGRSEFVLEVLRRKYESKS